jgi:hypothetical protein
VKCSAISRRSILRLFLPPLRSLSWAVDGARCWGFTGTRAYGALRSPRETCLDDKEDSSVGARDGAGKGVGPGLPEFRCGSHLMHMHLGGKRLAACSLPSGGQRWLIFFLAVFFIFCWLTSEHGPCPVDSVVITGCCFSRPKQHSNDYLTIFIGSLAMALQFSVKSYGWPRW